jgi:hypothetical protein
VHSVGAWDQIGYPVVVYDQGYPSRPAPHAIYDFDLCLFREDVPAGFWANPANAKYPNVHTYMREKRFGETFEQAIKSLDFRLAARVIPGITL